MPDEQRDDDGEQRAVLSRAAPGPIAPWRYGQGPDQVADEYPAVGGPGRCTVVLIHGGYWRPAYDRMHLRPLATSLAASGYRVISLEYRRNPGVPDDTVSDVATALAALPGYLTELGLDPSVVVVGHSAGGQLALWAAAQGLHGIRATVALAPIADLRLAESLRLDDDAVTAFLGGPARDRPDLDPARLTPSPTPVVLIHGDRDSVVPPELSSSYVSAIGPHTPAPRLVAVPDCGHFELIDPLSRAWSILLDELERAGA